MTETNEMNQIQTRPQSSAIRKLTFSAMVIAFYVVTMGLTQSFSFGAYQIRIATAIYALAYLFPFLIVPLGVANLLSNLFFGGLGFFDMFGGGLVGIATASVVYLLRKYHCSPIWIVLPITFIPGLGVATWLSYLLQIPYTAMATSLCIGQIVPGIVGAAFVMVLEKRINHEVAYER